MSHSRDLKRKRIDIDDGEEEFKVAPRVQGITLNEATVKNINERARAYASYVLDGLKHLEQCEIPLTANIIDNAILARGNALQFCIAIKVLYGEGITATDGMMIALNKSSLKNALTMVLLEIHLLPLTDQIVSAALLIDIDKIDDFSIALLTLHYHGYLYEHYINTLSEFPNDTVDVADQLVAISQAQSLIIDIFLNDQEQSEDLPLQSRTLPLPKVITTLVRTFFPHPGIMTAQQEGYLESYKLRQPSA